MGNAYYNLGAMHALAQVYGPQNVFMVPDLASWSWDVTGNFELLPFLDVDLLLLSGPTLRADIEQRYGTAFDAIVRRGGRIGFVSAGAAAYSTEERDQVARFLARYGDRLAFVATRDSDTYALFQGVLDAPVHDGICCSMFLKEAVRLPPISLDRYVVFNFGRQEPRIEIQRDGTLKVTQESVRRGFLSRRRPTSPQTELDGAPIVRTATVRRWDAAKIFYRSNTFYWDTPEGFLTLYAHAHSVFADRVHTCAATLALGGKAMYIPTGERSRDNRRAIFGRLGLDGIYDRPVSLDTALVEKAKQDLLAFLREHAG
jgi:hypothetical protein